LHDPTPAYHFARRVLGQLDNARRRTLFVGIYRIPIYNIFVIRSFRCKETKAIFDGERSKKFQSIERAALRKLLQFAPREGA
jgi:hypothetical protein